MAPRPDRPAGGADPDAVARAVAVLGTRAQPNAPLGALTTYRVGGPAALGVLARDLGDLAAVSAAVAVSGLDVLVVGRGSNLLVADGGFGGIAVSLDAAGEPFGAVDIDGLRVRAGAAVPLPILARRTADAGLTGLEWAVGVPGSVGGGVRMNAGGHGSDMAHSLLWVSMVDLGPRRGDAAVDVHRPVGAALAGETGGAGEAASAATPEGRAAPGPAALGPAALGPAALGPAALGPAAPVKPVEVEVADMSFRYRGSAVGPEQVVVSAEFRLGPGDPERSRATIRDIVRWRRDHQPGGQNAGSIFANPTGDPPANSAGWLVEAAGLRGRRMGSAMVSPKHANFIQADADGSADDVLALIMAVQAEVAGIFGVQLQTEVQLVGFPSELNALPLEKG